MKYVQLEDEHLEDCSITISNRIQRTPIYVANKYLSGDVRRRPKIDQQRRPSM